MVYGLHDLASVWINVQTRLANACNFLEMKRGLDMRRLLTASGAQRAKPLSICSPSFLGRYDVSRLSDARFGGIEDQIRCPDMSNLRSCCHCELANAKLYCMS